jgi:hypothetical protein
MTVHRYARGGYAGQGFVDDAPDSVLMQERTALTPRNIGALIQGPEASREQQPVMDPATMGQAWDTARRNYQNFPVREDEATMRAFEPSVRQEIGSAIAGEGGGKTYGSELRRRAGEALVGSSGLTQGVGALDFVPYVGQAMGATDIVHDINQGDYARAGINAAIPFAVTAAQKLAGPIIRSLSSTTSKIEIPRAPNLSPEERTIETRLADKIYQDPQMAMDEYSKLKDTANGRILNTDNARELSADYAANNDAKSKYSAAVHEPASWLTKWMYEQKLKQPPAENQRPMVLFTAGGTGAGKTTAIENIPEMSSMADRSQIIFDTNMNGYKSSKTKIDQALDAGKEVGVVYVYRDPIEALVNGALPRAMRMGRTVPIGEHLKTHVESAATIRKLADEYADNPNVNFQVIDNSLGKGKAAVSSLDTIRPERYNLTIDDLKSALDDAYANNRISEAVYRGTLGSHFGGSSSNSSSITAGKRTGGAVQKAASKDRYDPYVSGSGSKYERQNGKINTSKFLHDNAGRDLIGRALFAARKENK